MLQARVTTTFYKCLPNLFPVSYSFKHLLYRYCQGLVSFFPQGWILLANNPPLQPLSIKMAQMILLGVRRLLNGEPFSVLRIYSPPKIWLETRRWGCHHLDRHLHLHQSFPNRNVETGHLRILIKRGFWCTGLGWGSSISNKLQVRLTKCGSPDQQCLKDLENTGKQNSLNLKLKSQREYRCGTKHPSAKQERQLSKSLKRAAVCSNQSTGCNLGGYKHHLAPWTIISIHLSSVHTTNAV